MEQTTQDPELAEHDVTAAEQEQQNSFLYAATGQTPWWIVSVLLHGLVIALAGLMTLTMELGKEEAVVIQQTDFLQVDKKVTVEPHRDPTATLAAEEQKISTTDEKVDAQMIIAESLKQMAEISNEVTTDNPDKEDQHGAVGRPENMMRLTRAGSMDDAGGGGEEGREIAESMIGAGSASAGSGGLWGGGQDGGIGIGKGKGVGEWGNGRTGNKLRRYNTVGITRTTEDSVHAALAWLAYHQEADGSWNAKKYGSSVKTDTAITGMAMLAFLGAGHSEKFGEYKDTVKKAVSWLKSKQDADGMIWDTTDDSAHHRAKGYPCAIASLALIEAGGMANIPETRAAGQKAIDYICNVHQFGDGYDKRGWRYAPKSEGDLSVTGWFVMALKSGKICGFSVPETSMEGALKFLDSLEVKEQAGAESYGTPSRYKYMLNADHMETAHRLTAIGTLVRQFTGAKAEQLQATVDWFVNKGGVPSYGANGEKVDLYYWYYASLACYQQNKVQPELWKRWCDAMKSATVDNQCKQGDDRGSWNPTGDFSGEWGRVGQTALNALCLEVWYRYKVMDAGVH